MGVILSTLRCVMGRAYSSAFLPSTGSCAEGGLILNRERRPGADGQAFSRPEVIPEASGMRRRAAVLSSRAQKLTRRRLFPSSILHPLSSLVAALPRCALAPPRAYSPNSFWCPCFFLDSGAFLNVSSTAATFDGRSMPFPSINSFTVCSCSRGYCCWFILCV